MSGFCASLKYEIYSIAGETLDRRRRYDEGTHAYCLLLATRSYKVAYTDSYAGDLLMSVRSVRVRDDEFISSLSPISVRDLDIFLCNRKSHQ